MSSNVSLEPSSSAKSSISVASKGSPSHDTCEENRKMKDKVTEALHVFENVSGPLDLKLSNSSSVDSSSVLLNLFGQSIVVSSPFDESSSRGLSESRDTERKNFSCSYCKREFSTSQALGGHQNGHKQERALAKRRHEIMYAVPFSHPPAYSYHPYSYSSLSATPYAYYNRSLEIRPESKIYKPTWQSSFTPGVDSFSSSCVSAIAPSDKMRMEFFETHMEGFANFNTERSSGNNLGSPVVKPHLAKNHARNLEIAGEQDSSELDLTLKI